MFKRFILVSAFISLFSVYNAEVINVPLDYTTIQEGINASINGDTVLVQPGTYIENINFNGKNITLGSLFLTTQDTSYISGTIIDGNDNGLVVIFENGENYETVLCGFTIQSGYSDDIGGGILCSNYSSPKLMNLTIISNYAKYGGGIACYNASPTVENSCIVNNEAQMYGGGIYCLDSYNIDFVNITVYSNRSLVGGGIFLDCSNLNMYNSRINYNKAYQSGGGFYCKNSNPILNYVNITNNKATFNGAGLYISSSSSPIFSPETRCNIYSNSINESKGFGADIFCHNNDTIHVFVDLFTVINPTEYYISPLDKIIIEINQAVEDSLINSDVYVSVNGSNTNSGLYPEEPFRTITFALSKIYSDSININTIHIEEGIYSDSTNGEIFPIQWSSYVHLKGSSLDGTILDASQNHSSVIEFNFVRDALVQNVTITGGRSNRGGGFYCYDSKITIENIKIINNIATTGGGIYCDNCLLSIIKTQISSNMCPDRGGGIFSSHSDITLSEVTIDNCFGGGIYFGNENYSLTIDNTIITNNLCRYGLQVTGGNADVGYSNFWNNEAGNFYGLNDSIGLNVTTNANGDSCDAFYNIQMDPMFVDPANNDYHLQWGSPCIDAGDPNSPLDSDSTIADMGAYYYDQSMGIGPDPQYHQMTLINYPNPFQGSTIISFSIPQATKVKLQIYNILGQLVEQILNDDLQSGEGSIEWNSGDYPSGVYFYKLSTPQTSLINKMVIMK
ncbi:MAG: T9SS type A sorting domain-containing protein [Candidatus Cloacimonetes bacterium]|nr:T9SS type A sorting domain-containing protein [Candidatus Cloacimonadota bacterium]